MPDTPQPPEAPTAAPRPGRGRSPATGRRPADAELRRLRRRIDALDRRIVALLNERARVGLAAGEAKLNGGGRPVRDPEREREVLLRVAIANDGPLAQADLLAIYRRLIAATRQLEARALEARAPGAPAPGTRVPGARDLASRANLGAPDRPDGDRPG